MPADTDEIVAANRNHWVSEVDGFTVERYRQFAAHLPPSAKVILDVGCNTGRGGKVLKDWLPEAEVWGLDCVPERVEALDPTVYSRGLCSFASHIEMAGDSVDAIVAGEFIEHVSPVDVSPTLCEFFRILKLHGRLMLTTPNPCSIWKWMRKTSVLCVPSHATQHFPDCLKLRLREIGFSNVRIRGSGRTSLTIGSRFPLFLYGSYLVVAEKW